MDRGEFDELIEGLSIYFDCRNPSDARLGKIFEKKAVRDIPSEALEFVRSYIEDNHTRMPVNIGKALADAYSKWRDTGVGNKSGGTPDHDTSCDNPDCRGGFVFIEKNIETLGYSYEFVRRCPFCVKEAYGIPMHTQV